MREGRTTVLLQRAELWIGVELIGRAGQKPAAVIAAQVKAEGGDRATVIEDVRTRSTGLENGAADLQSRDARFPPVVDAADVARRIAVERAVDDLQACVAQVTIVDHAAAAGKVS